jgi:hypothetical protein
LKFYITGTRRGLGKALKEKYGSVETLEDCNVFINCKHDKFEQVDLLYQAARLKKQIINIGSNASDGYKHDFPQTYAIEKYALDKANEQLYYQGVHTSIVRFGYFDSERVRFIKNEPKMSIEYCVEVIDWILKQPHRVKEITITPKEK